MHRLFWNPVSGTEGWLKKAHTVLDLPCPRDSEKYKMSSDFVRTKIHHLTQPIMTTLYFLGHPPIPVGRRVDGSLDPPIMPHPFQMGYNIMPPMYQTPNYTQTHYATFPPGWSTDYGPPGHPQTWVHPWYNPGQNNPWSSSPSRMSARLSLPRRMWKWLRTVDWKSGSRDPPGS